MQIFKSYLQSDVWDLQQQISQSSVIILQVQEHESCVAVGLLVQTDGGPTCLAAAPRCFARVDEDVQDAVRGVMSRMWHCM